MKTAIIILFVSLATAYAGLTFRYRCGWCGLTVTSNMAVRTVCPNDGRIMYALPGDPRKP